MRHLLSLVLLLSTACGAEHPPLEAGAELLGTLAAAPLGTVRPGASEGFEAWSSLRPVDCAGPGMDPLTSWCSADAPPDGWTMATPTRWNELGHRTWETHAGRHALFFVSCALGEPRVGGCELNRLEGPTFEASPGAYRISWQAQRRANLSGWTPPGYVSPMGARVLVRFLSEGCSSALGEGRADAPDSATLWQWVEASAPVEAPAGTRCARFVLEVEALPRGLLVDSLELRPL